MPLVAVVVALVASGTCAVVCIAAGGVQDLREMRAGYTTVFGWHRDLDQVDPATGEVVRRSGEPLLSAKALRSRDRRFGAADSR